MKLTKKQHFNCKNCDQTSKVIFGNKVIFCSGLVKNPNPPCDKFRFCLIRGNKCKSATDVMIEELMAMLSNLSTTYLSYLKKHPITKPEDQIIK